MTAAVLSRETYPEQEPLQEPLSLSLTAFFTALKTSKIRNSQFDNSEGSICQLYIMEAEKMVLKTLCLSPAVEGVGPSPCFVRGELSVLPC